MISQLSAHAHGSHLTKARANSDKFINHGIKPSGQNTFNVGSVGVSVLPKGYFNQLVSQICNSHYVNLQILESCMIIIWLLCFYKKSAVTQNFFPLKII